MGGAARRLRRWSNRAVDARLLQQGGRLLLQRIERLDALPCDVGRGRDCGRIDRGLVAADDGEKVAVADEIDAAARGAPDRGLVDRLDGRAAARLAHHAGMDHAVHRHVVDKDRLAEYRDGHLTVWTHAQGPFPLRAILAQSLGLDAKNISVRHVQGPGCYGHNGADDAAADAAIVATLMPGRPIRVRWRREEEFCFEPVSPAMVVKVRAALDDAGRPADWTAEIWSGTHSARPGSGNLLPVQALPSPPPEPAPHDVPDAAAGGAVRNATPLYDIAAKRFIHHLVPETPLRTSALRGLGAMPNVFAIECFIDELAERAGQDPVAYRLAITSDPRARGVIERVAKMSAWKAEVPAGGGRGRGIGVARYKDRAAYSAVVVELEVDEAIRLTRMCCAADAGLVVNPDGAINQLEGGMIQSASWVLKEQVRLEQTGVASRDWETYPVLRFSEVPEITVELIASDSDVPLGVGEATAGPTAAAIGNAVAHALCIRIRDLPLTRERIMATLLADR